MENTSSDFSSNGRRDLPPNCVSRVRDEWRAARAAHGDLLLMGMPRVNLMVVGPGGPVQGVLELLQKTCAQPVVTWRPGERLALPEPERVRTVVLHDVDSMGDDYQRDLAVWLERAGGRTQVISTSPAPVLPRVHMGEFLDTLYYRLNVVYIDLTE